MPFLFGFLYRFVGMHSANRITRCLVRERFLASLAEDFNTPAALTAVFEWVREANRGEPGSGDADLREMLDILGLANLLEVGAPPVPPEVLALSEARTFALSLACTVAKLGRRPPELRSASM